MKNGLNLNNSIFSKPPPPPVLRLQILINFYEVFKPQQLLSDSVADFDVDVVISISLQCDRIGQFLEFLGKQILLPK